jgi:hypothetical protein
VLTENAAPRFAQTARLPALLGAPDCPTYDNFTPDFIKYCRKDAPSKKSVERSAKCQVYRRNDDIHVSQEDYYRAKIIREATGHHTRYRKNKRRNQELREYAAPS